MALHRLLPVCQPSESCNSIFSISRRALPIISSLQQQIHHVGGEASGTTSAAERYAGNVPSADDTNVTHVPTGNPIKNLPEYTYALPNDNGRNLYERIAAKSRWDINRLRITKGSDGSLVPNSRDNTIDQLGLYDQSQIFVKDLGAHTTSTRMNNEGY